MPLKLVPPRKGKSPFWSLRGTYLGIYIDRTTKAGKKNVAIQVLKKIESLECPLWANSGHSTRVRPFSEKRSGARQNNPDFGEFAWLRIDLLHYVCSSPRLQALLLLCRH
jgi:hypothetical protein